jgi:hypothetical protein
MTRARAWICAIVVFVAPMMRAPAQSAPSARNRCLDSVPLPTMKRVPVYATAELVEGDVVSRAVIAGIDLFTQAAAERARALLGAAPNQLPPGEPAVTWRQLDHELRVVAYRDGRFAWRVEPPAWLSDQSLGDSGVRLLGRAIDDARRKGEAFLWSDELARDSLTWVIRLAPSTLGEDGSVQAPTLRSGFPVFHVFTPPVIPAGVDRLRTNFPMVRIRGFAGTVRLQFVIDTAGRADPNSIRGVWPTNEPRLTGPPAFAYDSIVRVMRGAVKDARFAPARIGSCTINQLVQQSFTYRPAR